MVRNPRDRYSVVPIAVFGGAHTPELKYYPAGGCRPHACPLPRDFGLYDIVGVAYFPRFEIILRCIIHIVFVLKLMLRVAQPRFSFFNVNSSQSNKGPRAFVFAFTVRKTVVSRELLVPRWSIRPALCRVTSLTHFFFYVNCFLLFGFCFPGYRPPKDWLVTMETKRVFRSEVLGLGTEPIA